MKNKEEGIIILVTLWIMAILTIFALGIGYRTSLELRLARYQIDKIKTLYMAKAAVQQVKEYIAIDLNSDTRDYDSLYRCGIYLLPDDTPETMFKNIVVGDGFYTIKYKTGRDENNQPIWRYGLSDEERKININKADVNTLRFLFELLGIDRGKAESIAASIVDWRDSDSGVTPYGAENDYYQNLDNPYNCKNADFETLEELLLVKDVSAQIFNSIKDYLTVYGQGKVNINTASGLVLQALAMSNSSLINDPVVFANNVIDSRNGDDNIEGTADDSPISSTNFNFLMVKSSNFRAEIQSVSADTKVIKNTTAILDNSGAIKFWQEE